jgi:hypothetical protein
VIITPTLGTNYDLAVNLKYSDDTVDGVYQEDGVTLPLNEPYVSWWLAIARLNLW